MTTERIPVRLLNGAGETAQGAFVLDPDIDECVLALDYPGGRITATASDYFETMCEIRHELETKGWRPVCFGSSKNVYPSGMSRDMGHGWKAYKLRIGHPAKTADLVSIFDSAPDLKPASVEEQSQFFEEWLRSLSAGR